MESAFGIDHGEFSKAMNPLKAFTAARKVPAAASGAGAFKEPWEQGIKAGQKALKGRTGPGQTLSPLGGGNPAKNAPASVGNAASMRTMGGGANPAKTVTNRLGPVNTGVKPKWSI